MEGFRRQGEKNGVSYGITSNEMKNLRFSINVKAQ